MAEEIVEDYASSLSDLTFNSKPLINMLTMLAEENAQYAAQIAQVIEERLHKAKAGQLLPCLYLMDSIIKNAPHSKYPQLFQQNVVSNFCWVFEQVDEKTRQAMFKLRQTWNEIFNAKKLYALDIRVNQLDPAWPITSQPPVDPTPASIHVNPKFLNKAKKESVEPPQQKLAEEKEKERKQKEELAKRAQEDQEALMRQQLLAKQQELLKLQQQRLELELAETRQRLEQQAKSMQEKEVPVKQVKIEPDFQTQPKPNVPVSTSIVSTPAEGPSRDPRVMARDPRLLGRDPRVNTQSNTSAVSSHPDTPAQAVIAPYSHSASKAAPVATSSGKTGTTPSTVSSDTPAMVTESHRKSPVKSPVKPPKDKSPPKGAKKSDYPAHTKIDKKNEDKSTDKKKDVKNKDLSTSSSSASSLSKSSKLRSPKKEEKEKNEKKEEKDVSKSDSSRKSRHERRNQSKESENDHTESYKRGKGSIKSRRSYRKNDQESETSQRSRSRSPRSRSPRSQKSDHKNRQESQEKKSDVIKKERVSIERQRSPLSDTGESSVLNKEHDVTGQHIYSEGDMRKRHGTGSEVEHPPNKKIKSEIAAEEKPKLDDDISELFGKEDQDYRQMPPPALNISPNQMYPSDSLPLRSPSHSGWAHFKASRPEEFPFQRRLSLEISPMRRYSDQPPSPNSGPHDRSQPSAFRPHRRDMRPSAPAVAGRQTSEDGRELNIPSQLQLSSAEDILMQAELQLKSGKLSHEQHQLLLKQLTELYRLQKMKKELQIQEQKNAYQDENEFSKGEQAYNMHSQKLKKTINMGPVHRGRTSPPHVQPPLTRGRTSPPHVQPPLTRGRTSPPHVQPPLTRGRTSPPHVQPPLTRGRTSPPRGQPPQLKGRASPPRIQPPVTRGRASPPHHQPMMPKGRTSPPPSHNQHSQTKSSVPSLLSLDIKPPKQKGGSFKTDRERDSANTTDQMARPLKEQKEGRHKDIPIERKEGSHLPMLPKIRSMQEQQSVLPPPPVKPHEPIPPPHSDQELEQHEEPERAIQPQGYSALKDPRWMRLRHRNEPEMVSEIVLDNRAFEFRLMIAKPRKLSIDHVYRLVRADTNTGEIMIDNTVYYKIGDPPSDIVLNGKRHRFFYQGPAKNIWIDGQIYDVRVDAPPQLIDINGKKYEIRLDSKLNSITIGGVPAGPVDGKSVQVLLENKMYELQHEPPARQILIDEKLCELKFDGIIPVVLIDGAEHGIQFDGPPREVFINGEPHIVSMDLPRKVKLGTRPYEVAFGGPGHEIIINGRWFEVKFDGPQREVSISGRTLTIALKGSPPDVKILDKLVPEERSVNQPAAMDQRMIHEPQPVDQRMKESRPFQTHENQGGGNSQLNPPGNEDFRRAPNQGPRGNEDFRRGPNQGRVGNEEFGRGPNQSRVGNEEFGRGPNQGPSGNEDFRRGSNQGPSGNEDFRRGPNQGPVGNEDFGRGPNQGPSGNEDFRRGPNQGPSGNEDFRRGPNQGPRGNEDFRRGPNQGFSGDEDLRRGPNQGPAGNEDFRRGPNQGPAGNEDFRRGPNQGPPGRQHPNQGPGPEWNHGDQSMPFGPGQDNQIRPNMNKGPPQGHMQGNLNMPTGPNPNQNVNSQPTFINPPQNMIDNPRFQGPKEFQGQGQPFQDRPQRFQGPFPQQPRGPFNPNQEQVRMQMGHGVPQDQMRFPNQQPHMWQQQGAGGVRMPPIQQGPGERFPHPGAAGSGGDGGSYGVQGYHQPIQQQWKQGMPHSQQMGHMPMGDQKPAASHPPLLTRLPSQVDVNDLFSKLLNAGIISSGSRVSPKPEEPTKTITTTSVSSTSKPSTVTATTTASTSASTTSETGVSGTLKAVTDKLKEFAAKKEKIEPIPDLKDFKSDKLKKSYKGVIQRIYEGIQCSSCGVRFTAENTERYREHLDWHFRQNKRDKEETKVAKFRKWYYELSDWIQFEEISDAEERAQSAIFENILQGGAQVAVAPSAVTGTDDAEMISCPPASGSGDDVCFTCHDPFEQYWDEEEEEWHLKDAVRVGDKTYHPVCYEDAKEMSLLETPTPSTEEINPLSVALQQANLENIKMEATDTEVKTEVTDTQNEASINTAEPSADQNVSDNSTVVKVEPLDKKEAKTDSNTSAISADSVQKDIKKEMPDADTEKSVGDTVISDVNEQTHEKMETQTDVKVKEDTKDETEVNKDAK